MKTVSERRGQFLSRGGPRRGNRGKSRSPPVLNYDCGGDSLSIKLLRGKRARFLIGEDCRLDGTGLETGIAAHAVLGDDKKPARALRVLSLTLLDAVDGTNIHAGAFPFTDIFNDDVRHTASDDGKFSGSF
jgi:hypothetical protein